MSGRTLSRRQFLYVLGASAGAATLAACSGPAPAAPAAPAATAASAANAAQAQPTTAPAAASKGTVRISHWWGTAFSKDSKTIDVFQQKTGITVKDEAGVNDAAKMLTQLAAGTAADVMMVDAPQNGSLLPKKVFLELDTALAPYNLDANKWAADPLKENGYKGHIMGLSLFPMQIMIAFINKPMADATGVKLPVWGDSTKPASDTFDTWHWSDFVDFIKKGTKRKADGTIEQYGVDANWGGLGTYWGHYRYRVFDAGATEFDDPWGYEETKCTIDDPKAVAAVQSITDLVTKDKVAPTIEASGVEGGLFRAGKVMASLCWSGAHIYPPKDLKFEQAYIAFPWDNKRPFDLGGNYWVVNKASKAVDNAVTWAALCTTDYDVAHQMMSFNLPAYDTQKHISASDPGPFRECYQIWVSRSKTMSQCQQCGSNIELIPRWYGGRAPMVFSNGMNAAIQSILIGEKSAQQALTEVKTKVDAEILKVSSQG